MVVLAAAKQSWKNFYYGSILTSLTVARLGTLGYVAMQSAAIRQVIIDTGKVSRVYAPKRMPQTPAQLLRQINIMLVWIMETCATVH